MRWQLAGAFVFLIGCSPSEEAPSPAPGTAQARVSPSKAESRADPEAAAEPERRHLRDVQCVVLQPLGDVSEDTTAIVRDALASTYAVELRTAPRRALPDDTFYAPRKRYRAEKLLDHLDTWLPKDCDRIVGITRKDISTTKGKVEDWGILGYGRVPGKSCVVSSYRVRKKLGDVPADERLARVAIHELGHTLGLPHCPTVGCLMEDAQGSVVTIDRETHLCERCLRKIGWRGKLPPERPSFD